MNHNVEIKKTITLTSTDISDLLSAAFGGNFWALVDWHTTEYPSDAHAGAASQY